MPSLTDRSVSRIRSGEPRAPTCVFFPSLLARSFQSSVEVLELSGCDCCVTPLIVLSIRVVVTVEQTEEEVQRAVSCIREAAAAVLAG